MVIFVPRGIAGIATDAARQLNQRKSQQVPA
jgi:hypothetical protein